MPSPWNALPVPLLAHGNHGAPQRILSRQLCGSLRTDYSKGTLPQSGSLSLTLTGEKKPNKRLGFHRVSLPRHDVTEFPFRQHSDSFPLFLACLPYARRTIIPPRLGQSVPEFQFKAQTQYGFWTATIRGRIQHITHIKSPWLRHLNTCGHETSWRK